MSGPSIGDVRYAVGRRDDGFAIVVRFVYCRPPHLMDLYRAENKFACDLETRSPTEALLGRERVPMPAPRWWAEGEPPPEARGVMSAAEAEAHVRRLNAGE